MPELPEVETLRRELAKVLIGQVIKIVKIFWPKSVSPKNFAARLKGAKILGVNRRAKILLLDLTNDRTLAIHLKMTGQLVYHPLPFGEGRGGVIIGSHPEDPTKYTRTIFNFTDGSYLYFNDLRKFGWLKILSADHKKILSERHGVEPLSPKFNFKTFKTILNRYPNRRLKQTLLDQTLIAGLGNIYVDESCFASRIRPNRRIKSLATLEIKKLYLVIKRILKLAIAKGGTSARDYVRSDGSNGNFVPYLKVYGRAKQPCKICKTPIMKIKLAGRGTHFCPQCQK